MKPAGLSRGRGIKMYKSLSKINNFFDNKDSPWIIMKYIENPLICSARKVCFLISFVYFLVRY